MDAASLGFGPAAARPKHRLSKSKIFENHQGDVNGDELSDLLTHYQLKSTGIAPGDPEACLEGETLAGRRFFGCAALATAR